MFGWLKKLFSSEESPEVLVLTKEVEVKAKEEPKKKSVAKKKPAAKKKPTTKKAPSTGAKRGRPKTKKE